MSRGAHRLQTRLPWWLRALARRMVSARARQHLRLHLLLSEGADRPLIVAAPSQRILVLAPHMDDETLACGATIAAARCLGAEVKVVFLTDGRRGYLERVFDASGLTRETFEENLARTRHREAIAACAILGIDDLVFFDWPDNDWSINLQHVNAMMRLLADTDPTDIFLPFMTDTHPDHRRAFDLLLLCASRLPAGTQCWAYELWTLVPANIVVEIDKGLLKAKRAAAACHVSQMSQRDYVAAIEGLNRYRGLQCDLASSGEAFFRTSLGDLVALAELGAGVGLTK